MSTRLELQRRLAIMILTGIENIDYAIWQRDYEEWMLWAILNRN